MSNTTTITKETSVLDLYDLSFQLLDELVKEVASLSPNKKDQEGFGLYLLNALLCRFIECGWEKEELMDTITEMVDDTINALTGSEKEELEATNPRLNWGWFLGKHKDLNAVPYPNATRLSYLTNTYFLDEQTRKFDKLDKAGDDDSWVWFYHDIEPNRTYRDLMFETELMFQSIYDWQHSSVGKFDYDKDSKTIQIWLDS